MNSTSKSRFAIAVAALLVSVAVCGAAAVGVLRTLGKIFQLHEGPLAKIQQEYSLIAEQTPRSIVELNLAIYRAAALHDFAEWKTFQHKSRAFNDWIDRRKESAAQIPSVESSGAPFETRVGALIQEIDNAYDAYLEAAEQVSLAVRQPTEQHLVPGRCEKVDQRSKVILELSERARIQANAIVNWSLAESRLLSSRQLLFFITLLIPGVICGWFALVFYRKEVAPLRARLVESHSIIERQKKLAHLGEFAAGLAHEIRQPLTAINARLFTLRKALATHSAEHECAVVIQSELDRLNRIVEEFLNLGKPAEPNLAPISATAALKEVRDLLAPELEKKSIQLKLEHSEDARFRADAHQLKQVLINLIKNAAESITRNGIITLRAQREQRKLQGKVTDVAIIEVKDNGPGIPSDVQERLFDPFFSTKEKGMGLGLSISASIIEKHGGALEFHTRMGHGTTFGVILPLLKESENSFA
jgi:signal transduction histidine kinase